jgi:hypothetical protein
MAKPGQRKTRWLRYRKGDLTHNVFVALQRWIHAHGGSAIVMGGVETIVIPGDPDFIYHVGLRVTGKKPVKESGVISEKDGKQP